MKVVVNPCTSNWLAGMGGVLLVWIRTVFCFTNRKIAVRLLTALTLLKITWLGKKPPHKKVLNMLEVWSLYGLHYFLWFWMFWNTVWAISLIFPCLGELCIRAIFVTKPIGIAVKYTSRSLPIFCLLSLYTNLVAATAKCIILFLGPCKDWAAGIMLRNQAWPVIFRTGSHHPSLASRWFLSVTSISGDVT